MLLNGLSYSAALGYDSRIIVDCLAAGAKSASISGKGPAVAALVEKSKAKDVVSAMKSFAASMSAPWSGKGMMSDDEIKKFRTEIDKIDKELVLLLLSA